LLVKTGIYFITTGPKIAVFDHLLDTHHGHHFGERPGLGGEQKTQREGKGHHELSDRQLRLCGSRFFVPSKRRALPTVRRRRDAIGTSISQEARDCQAAVQSFRSGLTLRHGLPIVPHEGMESPLV
jgi:hypothetical protein